MSDRNPLVSVGIPVYNGDNFVAASIESLLDQTFEDFELIISDNGSTDDTEDICRTYAAKDARVRYHRSSDNRGAGWNFSRLVQLSRGKYFKWAAHDDLHAPEFLQQCVDQLESHPDAVLVMPGTSVIDAEGFRVLFPGNPPASGCRTHDEERRRLAHLASPHVVDRFHGVLMLSKRCYEVFALIRGDAIRASGAMRSFNGAEKVFLAELSLRGPFLNIDDDLFFSRWHDKRFSSNTSGSGQNQLFDPKKKKKWFVPPHELRCTLGYMDVLASTRMSVRDRLRCLAALARFVARPQKWNRIVVKFFTGRSNTAMLPSDYRRGDFISLGNATSGSVAGT